METVHEASPVFLLQVVLCWILLPYQQLHVVVLVLCCFMGSAVGFHFRSWLPLFLLALGSSYLHTPFRQLVEEGSLVLLPKLILFPCMNP